jgi:hypothetical protein
MRLGEEMPSLARFPLRAAQGSAYALQGPGSDGDGEERRQGAEELRHRGHQNVNRDILGIGRSRRGDG